MTLRLLFVSGASTGGAFRSSLELAEALEREGHTALVLVEAGATGRARLAKRLLDAEVGGRPPLLARLAGAVRRRIGTRARPADTPSRHVTSPVPENAVPGLARRIGADAVVVSSIRRPAWRSIRAWCRSEGILAVLYMRGVSELEQLEHPEGLPDLLLSNTRSVAETARQSGHSVVFVPSLVDLSRSEKESTREVALHVSPTELQGIDTTLAMAAARPDVRFALQESWELGADAAHRLGRRVAGLPNVELRARRDDPAEIYRDARILLAPHRVDNRPRVVIEAQANGIPVLATGLPGLIDQMGDGGVTVPADAEVGEWIDAFSEVWDDPDRYHELSERARRWARRPEQAEPAVVESFVAAVRASIEDRTDRPMER